MATRNRALTEKNKINVVYLYNSNKSSVKSIKNFEHKLVFFGMQACTGQKQNCMKMRNELDLLFLLHCILDHPIFSLFSETKVYTKHWEM